MLKKKQGFTLLELLIAATIIGILAVFATVSYRNTVADTRVAGARAKLDVLAGAVQRYRLDPSACPNITSSSALTITNLVNCGYLEKSLFSVETDEYFSFQICGAGAMSTICPSTAYLACMTGESAKLPGRYLKSKGYLYCLNQTGKPTERLGSE